MGTSHSGHKHDASEGSEIVSFAQIDRSAFLESICFDCIYFEVDFDDFYPTRCVATDESGRDLYSGHIWEENCVTECPYFVKKEQL